MPTLVPKPPENFMELRQHVIGLINRFTSANSHRPIAISFPPEIENVLLTADANTVGDKIASILVTDGPKEAFKRFLGLTVKWGGALTVSDEAGKTLG